MHDFSLVEILTIGSASGAVGAGGVVWFMIKKTLKECVTRQEFNGLTQREEQNIADIKDSIRSMSDGFRRELSLMAKSNSEQHAMIIKMLENVS